jgi:hypothetical protein
VRCGLFFGVKERRMSTSVGQKNAVAWWLLPVLVGLLWLMVWANS